MAAVSGRPVAEGQWTATVYGLIRDGKHADAIRLLSPQLENFPRSRAALSLLAYCSYQGMDFVTAAHCYDQLIKLAPDSDEYKVYHAQALYKAGMYAEATRACLAVENPQYHERMLRLRAYIKYEQDELQAARSFVDQCIDDPDVVVAQGCILYKEGKVSKARAKFQEAQNLLGFVPSIVYNIALCYYRQKNYGHARKHLAEIIERGVKEHPELSVGSNTEGVEVRSVGNTQALEETMLIQAFNLKAAIDYIKKDFEAAKVALTDMPPREEEELDPVTLHNQALMRMSEDPSDGLEKLAFLLTQEVCPPETFQNLLLLYCKHQLFNMAADVLAENAHLTYKLEPELFEFLDALITQQTSPEEAFRKFDGLAQRHTETLRKLIKSVQDAKAAMDADAMKTAVRKFDEALEGYIPVLMAQAKIYWDRENYRMVEKLFRQNAEYCSEHETWRLNVAHVFFMEEKYREAIRYYSPIVANSPNLLNVTASVLANLCVSYIMTTQNDEAEAVMRTIELAEEKVMEEPHRTQPYHLCIVNLVIGTLYCAKGNYEFGISRIIKSLEPFNQKLQTDTWFYAKMCFLGLLETLAKHMIMLPDTLLQEILLFLDAADQLGKTITTDVNPVPGAQPEQTKTVSYEARMIKRMLLRFVDE